MKQNTPPGFQVLSSPGYQWVILDSTDVSALRDLCIRLNHFIQSFGYKVQDWRVNPIVIVNVGGWVLPGDQVTMRDWLMRQEGCKYVRTQRDKNLHPHTMQLGILHESQVPIDLCELGIS